MSWAALNDARVPRRIVDPTWIHVYLVNRSSSLSGARKKFKDADQGQTRTVIAKLKTKIVNDMTKWVS